MEYKLTNEEELNRTFSVTVPSVDLDVKLKDTAKEYHKHAELPGFRPGKAPLAMVKQRFAKQIRRQTVEDLMPDWINTIINENDHKPVSDPHLHGLEVGKSGDDITFEMHYEVHPTVELSGYESLSIEVPKLDANESMLETYLENVRKDNAVLEPVEDRASQKGDVLVVDMEGQAKEPREDEQPEKHENVNLNPPKDEKEEAPFYDAAMGLKKGDSNDFDHTFPEEYPDEAKKGRTFSYKVTLTDLRLEVKPELDDEFAKDMQFESLDAMKDDVRQKLAMYADDQKRRVREDVALNKLKELCPITVPKVLAERETKARLESFAMNLQQRGVSLDSGQINWPDLFETKRKEAEDSLRALYLLDFIANKEDINLEEADWAQAAAQEVAHSGAPPEQVTKAFMDPEFREQREAGVLRQKALSWVIEKATITEKDEPKKDSKPAAKKKAKKDQPEETKG